jgi:hypothetical protein
MSTYTLPRSGQRPLRFTGTLLADGDTQSDSGPCNTRWWAVEVYQIEYSARYVLALQWRTNWQGEQAHDAAIQCESLDAVGTALEQVNPLEHLIGFPHSGDGKYAERQRHVEKVLVQAWAALVSEILGTLDIAEEAE